MQTPLKALIVGAGLALAAGSFASAAPYGVLGARQAGLEARIDAGERDSSLTRMEAARLRSDLNSLKGLERIYNRGGLNVRERADLSRRFDNLSARVYDNRHDRQRRK